MRHNRLKELNGFTFSYDAFGRTIEKSHGESRRTWRYAYNSEDQLVEASVITRSGFRKIRFTYDLLGRRIAKSDGKTETRFTWSGMRLLSESKGERTSTYVYEYESYVPLARLDSWNAEHFTAQGRAVPNTPGQVYYFHCNASGMPEELTDSEGNIVWRARYAAWGKVVFENVTGAAPDGFEQNLRMQGQYHDRETGLYYNTFRYYDCDTGRFTTEDPLGLFGGINLYQYAPNPLSWIDPWGLKCWNTARKAFWKNEAKLNPTKYSQRNLARMNEGLAPKMQVRVFDHKTGRIENRNVSMEVHHKYLHQRGGSDKAHEIWNLEKATPWRHASMDPHRHTGYDLIRVIKGTNSW